MAGQLLAACHPLVVHDVRREAAADLLAAGAGWAESPADLAVRSEVVATCLPGPAEMEPVCLGSRGILEGIKPGAVYVDHPTNSPLLVRRPLRGPVAGPGVARTLGGRRHGRPGNRGHPRRLHPAGTCEHHEPDGPVTRCLPACELRAAVVAQPGAEEPPTGPRAGARHGRPD